MLHFFLVILKIIGITLAVVLGLLLVLVLAVLFIPFYYEVEGRYNTLLEEKNTSVKGKVSFLGPFLKFKFRYEEEFYWDLKLFFLSLKSFIVKENGKTDTETAEEDEIFFGQPVSMKEDEPVFSEPVKKSENEEPDSADAEYLDNAQESDSEQKKRKKDLSQRILELKQKVISFFGKIKQIVSKAKEIIQSIQNLLEDERFKAAFFYGKDEVLAVIKKVWPHIKYMDVHYGTQDPALTGQILGAVSIVQGMSNANIQLMPDFESEEFFFNGQGKLKGKIRICDLVKLWYKYKCDKEIKYLKYKIKKVRRSFQ